MALTLFDLKAITEDKDKLRDFIIHHNLFIDFSDINCFFFVQALLLDLRIVLGKLVLFGGVIVVIVENKKYRNYLDLGLRKVCYC